MFRRKVGGETSNSVLTGWDGIFVISILCRLAAPAHPLWADIAAKALIYPEFASQSWALNA